MRLGKLLVDVRFTPEADIRRQPARSPTPNENGGTMAAVPDICK